ncbi:Rhodanese-like domain-containing protein [Ustulina deusta]|nr:Rhodanese-like domain-containing protein [Ustulina deusta]
MCDAPSRSGVRWSTTAATGSKIWTFEEIQSLTTTPGAPKPTLLIDVREPAELRATGRIPGALNIPITTAPDSFHISAAEFEDRFGFARPARDAAVVFYCKAGVRSRAAAGIARDAGWADVGEFPGSWIEWAEKGGAVER